MLPLVAMTPSSVDLIHASPGDPRIYVRAGLPDGSTGTFMVDTGADISILTTKTAERLGLVALQPLRVSGMAGTSIASYGVVPSLQIGGAPLADIGVAWGVAGLGERAGDMRVDGVLGNNVWSRFLLEIDYPADVLVLHPPGGRPMPAWSQPLYFDGEHPSIDVTLATTDDPPIRSTVRVQLDTGSAEVYLTGAAGTPFAASASAEGLEIIGGVGSEHLDAHATRRICLDRVAIGGRSVDVHLDAFWITDPIGPSGLSGLVGHKVLSGHVALIDYAGGRFALEPSRRTPRHRIHRPTTLSETPFDYSWSTF